MTLKFYKCACEAPHLHKISNLTKKIVSTCQFTFDYKVLKRYMIRKIVKQGIIWFSNMLIRYFTELCEPCLNAPEFSLNCGFGMIGGVRYLSQAMLVITEVTVCSVRAGSHAS